MSDIDDVIKRMNEVLSGCPAVMKPVMAHLQAGSGKNIRAALVMATARALGGVNEKITDLAAAVEILHLSTLIHDDIIDGSKMRRGMETVYSRFGKKTAVLAGDFLFTKCFSLIANKNRDRIGDFSSAVAAVCLGEILQEQNIGNYDLTERQYYKIIAGKTAAIFALCMSGTAYEMLGEDTDEHKKTVQRLGMAGYYFGMVFQMIDDCLDYEGSERKIKKTVLKDLDEGVVTYPLIYVIQNSPAVKSLLAQKRTKENKGKIEKEVLKCGGVKQARRQAKVFYDRAVKKINLALGGENSGGLLEILELIYCREG